MKPSRGAESFGVGWRDLSGVEACTTLEKDGFALGLGFGRASLVGSRYRENEI